MQQKCGLLHCSSQDIYLNKSFYVTSYGERSGTSLLWKQYNWTAAHQKTVLTNFTLHVLPSIFRKHSVWICNWTYTHDAHYSLDPLHISATQSYPAKLQPDVIVTNSFLNNTQYCVLLFFFFLQFISYISYIVTVKPADLLVRGRNIWIWFCCYRTRLEPVKYITLVYIYVTNIKRK